MVARELTEDEYGIYAGSAALAIEMIPSFRDVVVLLRPFADFDSECVYVDRYSRICLSKAFFGRSRYQRATTVLHETMHVLNRHFERADAAQIGPSDEFLVAADFEIGTTLVGHPRADTSHQIVPDRDPYDYPANLTFEQYYQILAGESASQPPPPPSGGASEADEDGESGDSESDGDSDETDEEQDSSSGDGSPQDSQSTDAQGDSSDEGEAQSNASKAASESGCKNAGEKEENDADNAGIERASDSESLLARQHAEIAIAEDLEKSLKAGNSAMKNLLGRVETLIQPPKANWRTLLPRFVNRASMNIARGRSDYTFRKPNRRLSQGEFIFPGMLAYKPAIALGVDTSGSMQKNDFQVTLSEVAAVLETTASSRDGVKVFSIDTELANEPKTVRRVEDIEFKGGGGTDMAPAFAYVRKMKRDSRPDVFILATDGGFDWGAVVRELRLTRKLFSSIILITERQGYTRVPEEAKQLATVIDIS